MYTPVCKLPAWAVVLLLAASGVLADGRDDVERCARLAAAEARIACLEAALLGDAGMGKRSSAERRQDAAQQQPGEAAVRDFGLDSSQKQADEPLAVEVLVIAIDENAYGKMLYTTDDGQVWRQTDQRSPRYADLPFRAEIRGAASGSFFLQPVSGGVAVRVRRWK